MLEQTSQPHIQAYRAPKCPITQNPSKRENLSQPASTISQKKFPKSVKKSENMKKNEKMKKNNKIKIEKIVIFNL